MEFLNRIEIQGIVGNASVSRVAETRCVRFSVATNYTYKNKKNEPVIETNWFNVTAWEGKGVKDAGNIKKGSKVNVKGRVRCTRYTADNGLERIMWEIVPNKVTILEEEDPA